MPAVVAAQSGGCGEEEGQRRAVPQRLGVAVQLGGECVACLDQREGWPGGWAVLLHGVPGRFRHTPGTGWGAFARVGRGGATDAWHGQTGCRCHSEAARLRRGLPTRLKRDIPARLKRDCFIAPIPSRRRQCRHHPAFCRFVKRFAREVAFAFRGGHSPA